MTHNFNLAGVSQVVIGLFATCSIDIFTISKNRLLGRVEQYKNILRRRSKNGNHQRVKV